MTKVKRLTKRQKRIQGAAFTFLGVVSLCVLVYVVKDSEVLYKFSTNSSSSTNAFGGSGRDEFHVKTIQHHATKPPLTEEQADTICFTTCSKYRADQIAEKQQNKNNNKEKIITSPEVSTPPEEPVLETSSGASIGETDANNEDNQNDNTNAIINDSSSSAGDADDGGVRHKLLDRQLLLQKVLEQRELLLQKLKVEYGEYFESIFVRTDNDNDNGAGNDSGDVPPKSSKPKVITDEYRPIRPITEEGEDDDSPLSMIRLKRKLMIKLLKMQAAVLLMEEGGDGDGEATTTASRRTRSLSDFPTIHDGCSCSVDGKSDKKASSEADADSNGNAGRFLRNDHPRLTSQKEEETTKAAPKPKYYESYVWATGGHSASAGHGNLYNESYTAFLERDLQPIFESVGIEFVGRNYAMGGTSSAPTISMCWKEFFGTDVDFFSWDYGMTDGNGVQGLLHYLYRGGISPGRPAMLSFKINGRARAARTAATKSMEDAGFAAFYGSDVDMTQMDAGFPDTAAPDQDIANLPDSVRYYKCGTSIEKGDPSCGAEKYTKHTCPKRGKQTSWHPGWKTFARDGHGMALFLMNALIRSIQDLIDHPVQDPQTLLDQLEQEETDLYQNITESMPLPPLHIGGVYDFKNLAAATGKNNENDEVAELLTTSMYEMIYRSPSICKPAKLPAETRYLGYFNNEVYTNRKYPAPYEKEEYYVGIEETKKDDITAYRRGIVSPDQNNNDSSDNNDGITNMPLLYELKKSQRELCDGDRSVIVKPDYPDYFYTPYDADLVNNDDNNAKWTTMVFPNREELRAYSVEGHTYKGVLFLHIQKCDWGRCPSGDLKLDKYNNDDKAWIMRINGVEVSNIAPVSGNDVGVPVKADGSYTFEPDSNGQYKIEIKVNQEGGYVRISSFVLY